MENSTVEKFQGIQRASIEVGEIRSRTWGVEEKTNRRRVVSKKKPEGGRETAGEQESALGRD